VNKSSKYKTVSVEGMPQGVPRYLNAGRFCLGGVGMKTIELKNSFHGTKMRIRVPGSMVGQAEAWLWVQEPIFTGRATAAQKSLYRRIRRKLCGMSDCSCGIVC
jgi:hypothetical protein